MRTEELDRPSLRPTRLVIATMLVAVVVVAVAIVLPEGWRFLALVVAFAAGIGLERYRHSFFPAPPTLKETPEAWRYLLRYEVGFGQLAVAALLLTAAIAVLLVSFDSGEDSGPAPAPQETPSAGPAPQVPVETEKSEAPFTTSGVRFNVSADPDTGGTLPSQSSAEKVVAVTVEMENLRRASFNPALITFRLRDADGLTFAPTESTARSDELAKSGSVDRGGRVEQDLLFSLPRESRKLALEFEPVPNGAKRVRVALP